MVWPEFAPMAEKKRCGFTAMDLECQREITQLGDQAAHARGKAPEFTREEAHQAGKKGGLLISQDRAYMTRIARKGGNATRRNKSRRDTGNN
jgi:general stress protein YciG